jgi:hypothetical protein
VIAYIDEVVINTYNWQEALVATAPDDDVYPYPRLDHGRVGPPSPRTYETVVLENEYARVTLLPELGGRIYRWYDKPSGQEMFYVNPVIKPTRWGARGWWLATGGMEWAFPVDEHGLVEWRPWGYEIVRTARGVGVQVADTEDRTGLVLEITVLVEVGRAGYTVQPRITNPTDADQSYQFWLNGMFALSPANRPSPDLRFTLPVDAVLVHSTGDMRFPKPNESMSWPIYEGIDVSRYGIWEGWLGVFAMQSSYMGAYDPTSRMGVARVYPSATSQGAKIFGPGTLDPSLWTDDGSGYVELWGGLTPTFWDYATLAPGRSVTWQERWYGLNGLGGLSFANDQAALWLAPGEGMVQVGALTTQPLAGRLALLRNGETVQTWEASFRPDAPFRATHPLEDGGRWELRLVDGGGQVVAAYTDPR